MITEPKSDINIWKIDGESLRKDAVKELVLEPKKTVLTPEGRGVPGASFAGYVPLASQSPYPIIVYFWSILWPIILVDPILVTFGQIILLLSKSRKSATPF